MRRGNVAWQVASVLLLLPISALASTLGLGLPGSGTIGDPTYDEGIVYTVGGGTFAGDVILCESTSLTCNTSTPTSEWSDVLVFFNSAKGPYPPDSTRDANSAYVFSDDDSSGTFGGLANFLANYGGALSSNAQAVLENPNGPTIYGNYVINSPEGSSGVPEPGGFLLAGPILVGLAGLVRYRNFTKS